MNRAVVVLLLLIANAVVSTRTLQPPGISPAWPQDRSRAHSRAAERNAAPDDGRSAERLRGRFASAQPPASDTPSCRDTEDPRAASWLRL